MNYMDVKGLESQKCDQSPCSRLSELKPGIDLWCTQIDKRIKDVGLAQCIKKRCQERKINCSQGCPEGMKGFYDPRYPEYGIFICVQEPSLWSQPNPSDTVIHEWAHSCGWEHGDGKGIPNDPGRGKPDL